jgi:hypothetical protein
MGDDGKNVRRRMRTEKFLLPGSFAASFPKG